jgi:hypothetical protein
VGVGQDHRSLAQLLRELQQQAEEEAPDQTPGASVRCARLPPSPLPRPHHGMHTPYHW